MKFSYNWMAEMLDGLTVPPAEIGKLITMKTAECEGVEQSGEFLRQVCIAQVVQAEPIPGTHLTKALVDAGPLGQKQVVCGAPNCRAGLLTAYCPPGTKLPDKEIRAAEIRGVFSEGMLASAAELALGRDDEGIMELERLYPGQQLTPGSPLPEVGPDTIVEIDNKSLTHRPDLWGHHGMAREVAAITGARLKEPVNLQLLPSGEPPIQISIADARLCPRYSALVFENVTIQPSPLWLQQRLESVGINPINNIVDVTNFLAAELAQPTHAFDLDKLQGRTIFVRPAEEGELCPALNGNTYTLDPTNLVIADSAGPVAIAGVIGGGPSAISESTTRILFESATFQASSVRKTSSKLKLRTDASMRFEKSQDPVNTTRALARAIALLQIVSPGIQLVGGLADAYTPLPAPAPIPFTLGWMQRKLGRQVTAEQVQSILTALCFGVETQDEGEATRFTATVPSWRATKDVSLPDDLVEEVGRMIGYGEITPAPPLVPTTVPPLEPKRSYLRSVREQLAAQGFTEVYNYSFISQAQAEAFSLPLEDHIRVLNPIAQGQELLRTSLLPNLLRNIQGNAKELDEFRLFEIGKEIHKQQGQLPAEVVHLAVARYSRQGDGQQNLLELKRVAEGLAPGLRVRPATARPYEHPHRAAEVVLPDGTVFGRLFELHPKQVETGRAAVLDCDLDLLFAKQPGIVKYRPLRKFPSSDFDLSVIVEQRTLAADVQQVMQAAGGTTLLGVSYLYEYAGQRIGAGKRSITFRCTLGATDRTLQSEEIGATRSQIIAALESAQYTVVH